MSGFEIFSAQPICAARTGLDGASDCAQERMSLGQGADMWTDQFPQFMQLDAQSRARLQQGAQLVTLPAGHQVFAPGQSADNFLLLISGGVRVEHLSDSGRQIVLYRVSAGESCVMTTACLMGQATYSAFGVTEEETTGVLVPRALFDELVASTPVFRAFVFQAYGNRITDLLLVIDEVAFQRLDLRLAQRLIDLAQGRDVLVCTHQDLATELGTAREVVTRQLAELQRRGLIGLARGEISLIDRPGLTRLAQS